MKTAFLLLAICGALLGMAQPAASLKKKDRKKDVELLTTEGRIVLRLSDSTPQHRDNFLRLVKTHFYDSVLFHRVIKNFVVQAGDPASKTAAAGVPLGNGGLGYTVPAEIVPGLPHRRGALGMARKGDGENPARASSSTQFYIVQGKTFTDPQLDSVEVTRLQGRKLTSERRTLYQTVGGTPQLDGSYTVFGEVVSGMDVVDKIAALETSKGADKDRPITDSRIIAVKLVKRKAYL